jgi:soluble lytic murein transglycosylase-like protein
MITNRYDDLIQRAAATHLPGIDWRIWKAQLYAESSLDPLAESPKGAVGLSQMMPLTWAAWSPKAGFKGALRTDARASIFTGAMYMRWLLDEWDSPRPDLDRYCLAAASYNCGLGNALKAQTAVKGKLLYAEIAKGFPTANPNGAKETLKYVKTTLEHYIYLLTEIQ